MGSCPIGGGAGREARSHHGRPSRVEQTDTVDFFLANQVRLEGGPRFRVDSVEYQGTLDGVPLEEALEVTLIVRVTVTDIEQAQLVRDDGTVDSTVESDPTLEVGGQYSQTVSLGRIDVSDAWQLSALGALG